MDWDQDGKLDILSGCYWTDDADGAHLQILKGRGKLDFAEAEPLKNVAGKPLQNASVSSGSQVDVDVICTQQHAVDYDNDGDLDLVVGCFGTKFFLFENSAGQDGKNAIVEQAIVLPIQSTSYHSAPHLVDWDNDGDLDLLSGSSDGGAIISENIGTREEPDWSEFTQLVPPSNLHEQALLDDETAIAMGPSTRIWATDWNGDGWQDLLIGDKTTISRPVGNIDDDTWQQRRAADDEKIAAISAEMQEVMPEYQQALEKGEDPPEAIQAKMQEYNSKIQEIHSGRAKYQQTQSTGHVWLLIRKPDEAAAETLGPI